VRSRLRHLVHGAELDLDACPDDAASPRVVKLPKHVLWTSSLTDAREHVGGELVDVLGDTLLGSSGSRGSL
jgi:hypothetical protein